MASTRPKPDVEMEPPRKRQKVTSPLHSAPIPLPEGVSNAESEIGVHGRPACVDTGFQPERESQVGILHFVNASNLGFSGILKQRYTDFLVNEIAPGGKVVHLTDDRAPKAPRNTPSGSANNVSSHTNGAQPATLVDISGAAEQVDIQAAPTSATPDVSTKGPQTENKTPVAAVSDTTPVSVSEISNENRDLLIQYFGTSLVDQILELDKKIQSRPDSKPAAFGFLLSEPITDRPLRGRIHGAIRNAFNSRIETEAIEDGVIRFTAAPKAVRSHQNGRHEPKAQNSRNQNQRGQMKGKLGWQELGGDYLHFSLYKENKDTMEVISFLSKQLRTKPKDFSFAGTKDRRAVTVQRVSVWRQRAETLANLNWNLKQSRVGDFKHEKHSLELGELAGNQFTITLRDCHFGDDAKMDVETKVAFATDLVGQAVKQLQANGFINYFGLQRFGTFGIGTHEIGMKILKEDFEGAVTSILTFSPESLAAAKYQDSDAANSSMISRDDIARAAAINEYKTTGKTGEAFSQMPRKFSAEVAVIRHLASSSGKNDHLGAILTINRNLRTMYVHAYQSLVWNNAASERWARYGNRVVKGDLIIIDPKAGQALVNKEEIDENGEPIVLPAADDSAVTHDDLFERARPLSAEEAESGKYTIFDIVLPTPGYDIEFPDNEIGDYYKSFMSSELGGGLDPANMRRKQKDFSLSGSYRKFIARVGQDLSFEIKKYYNETEQLVETDLERLQKSRGHHAENKSNGRPGQQNGTYRNGSKQHSRWINNGEDSNAKKDDEIVNTVQDQAAPLAAAQLASGIAETSSAEIQDATKKIEPAILPTVTSSALGENNISAGEHEAIAKLEPVGYSGTHHEEDNENIQPAKIAVIIKFSLGSSQYATMALRELMKDGGVKTYKPDFSGGR